MELVYLLIKKSNIGINNQEIKFSDNFFIESADGKLIIKNTNKNRLNIFEPKISNISVLVGKNGTGKSTIFESLSLNGYYKKKFLNSFHTLAIFYCGKIRIDSKECDYYFIEFDSYTGKFYKNLSNSGLYYSFNEQLEKVDLEEKNNQLFEKVGCDLNNNNTLLTYIRLQPNLSWLARKEYLDKTTEKKKYITKSAISSGEIMHLLSFINDTTKINNNAKLDFKIKTLLPQDSPKRLFYIYHWNIEFGEYDEGDPFFENDIVKLYNSSNRLKHAKNSFEIYIIDYLERILLNLVDKSCRTKEHDLNSVLKMILQIRGKRDYSFYLNINNCKFNQYIETNGHISEKMISSSEQVQQQVQREINENDLILYLNNVIGFLLEAIEALLKSKEEIDDFRNTFSALSACLQLGKRNSSNKLRWNIDFRKLSCIENFIEKVQQINQSKFGLDIKLLNISDGEGVFINTFSTIYSVLKKKGYKNKILLLDEPDLNLHPEWSRRFISILKELVDNNFEGDSLQIIISTHSPFIVSDIPKNNVFNLILSKDILDYDNANKSEIIIENAKVSFGANIYELMSDSFFMKASIGEFARKIILKYIENKEKIYEVLDYIDDDIIKNMIERREKQC